MAYSVVNCFLDNSVERNGYVGWKIIEKWSTFVIQLISQRWRCRACTTFQKRFNGLAQSEELQNRRLSVVYDNAELSQTILDVFVHGLKFSTTHVCVSNQSFQCA